MRASTTSRFKL